MPPHYSWSRSSPRRRTPWYTKGGETAINGNFKVYDAAFVNQTTTTIVGGQYGRLYIAHQAKVTIKGDAKIDTIDSYAITTNNLGQLVIEAGATVGTIYLHNTGYPLALVIEEGATVGEIIYV